MNDSLSTAGVNNQPNNTAIIKRNRFFGVVIILIVVLPMVAAYFIHQAGWVVTSGTTNKGELLQPPLQIQLLPIMNDDLSFDQLYAADANKKWRFLVPVSADCSDICQQNLYTSRQVHIRLAEKSYRVERMLLMLGELPSALMQQLEQEHPNTRLIFSKSDQLSSWLAAADVSVDLHTDIGNNAKDYYYLVDQEGFAMMRYSHLNTGHDVLDDIKKLLKFTYDK